MVSTEKVEELRRREEAGEAISAEERAVLDRFYARLDAEEMRYLQPALDRLERQHDEQQEVIRELEGLRARKREYLEQVRSLVRAIEEIGEEERRVLARAGV